jgi:hypothetical protein
MRSLPERARRDGAPPRRAHTLAVDAHVWHCCGTRRRRPKGCPGMVDLTNQVGKDAKPVVRDGCETWTPAARARTRVTSGRCGCGG